MDRETAIEIEKRIGAVLARLFEGAETLRPRLSTDDFRMLAEVLADVTCELDLGVLEVVYRAHADLRPGAMSAVGPFGAS